MINKAKGGNVKLAKTNARVDITKKSALVAVEVPNAPANPKAIKAKTIDEALENLKIDFKFPLRRLNGTTSKEKYSINTLDGFEESVMKEKLDILKEQKMQMDFLHDFQNELQHNPVFVEELKAFLIGEQREKFMRFLKLWQKQLKKPSPQFIEILNS